MCPALVILNPMAGGGAAVRQLEHWKNTHEGIRFRSTREPGDARRWARDAAREGVKLVVAAGGDGTAHEVANGILEADAGGRTALGLVPLGTGNDLARSLGVPLAVAQALERLDRRHVREMDVASLRLDGEGPVYFVNTLAGGFAGALHEAMEPEVKRNWGPLSYLRSGVEAWADRTLYRLTIEVDGEKAVYDALNVVVANGASAGAGLKVAPGADLFDGALDVAIILETRAAALGSLATALLAGAPEDHEAMARLRGRVIRVSCTDPLPVSIDGEAGEASEISVKVEPGKLLVIMGD